MHRLLRLLSIASCAIFAGCATSVKTAVYSPSDISFLSGKWKSVAIADPKNHGPEFGWELDIKPDGSCTILTDARHRVRIRHEVAFFLENGVPSFISGENGDRYVARFDSTGRRLSITAPELIGWTMSFIKSNDSIPELHGLPPLPRTLRDAVRLLYSELSEKDGNNLLFWHYWELTGLHLGYGMWIRNRFRLGSGNEELLASCGSAAMPPDEASGIILKELAKEVRKRADPEVALCLHLQDKLLQETLIPTDKIEGKRLSAICDGINGSIRDRTKHDSRYESIKDFRIALEITAPTDTVFSCGDFQHFFKNEEKAATINKILFAIAGFYGLDEVRDAMTIRLFNCKEERLGAEY